jgi:hypothetical protein
MRRWALALGLVGGWVAACGGRGDSHAGSVNGTFAGSAVTVADTTAFSGTLTDPSGKATYLGEVLANAANVCSLLQNHAAVSGLSLLIVNMGGDAAPAAVAPGSYGITNGAPAKDTNGNVLVVLATYNAVDSSCHPTYAATASDASAGTITIDSVSPTVSGGFDLTFPNGDHLTGSFASEVCAAPGPVATNAAMNTAASAAPACQP